MAVAGAVLAALLSTAMFLYFPPGLRMEVGGEETDPFRAAFAPSAQAASFQPASKAEATQLQLPEQDTPLFGNGLARLTLPASEEPPARLMSTVVTQELLAYATASTAVTALSWTEEDAVIPLYESALISTIQTLSAASQQAASSRESVERAEDILALALHLLQGSEFSALPQELRTYVRDTITDPEQLFERSGSERFRCSPALSRFQASVIWIRYATALESSRDPACIAALGFAVASSFPAWSKLSAFYTGLVCKESLTFARLAMFAVSVFGHSLTEEEMTDPALLESFSSSMRGQPWGLPFEVSLLADPLEVVSLTQNLPPVLPLSVRVSRLRDSRAAVAEEVVTGLNGLGGIWLGQLITSSWNASTSRTVEAIAGSYATLLTSSTAGLELSLPAGQSTLVEANPDLVSSLGACLVGMYTYLSSTVGISDRARALLSEAHYLLSSIAQAPGSSSGVVSLDRSWGERFTLLLRVSGLRIPVLVTFHAGQTLHDFVARLISSEVNGNVGAVYVLGETFEEG